MPPVDVFITTAADSLLRYAMKDLVRTWWYEVGRRYPGRFTIQEFTAPTGARKDFEKRRREIAEAQAVSPLYILMDDDILPTSLSVPENGLIVLEDRPQFGMLSVGLLNEQINKWGPENYTPYEDSEVFEHEGVGGMRFIRKGVMKDWPVIDLKYGIGYDPYHCQAMRDAGYKVGYMKSPNLALHLGRGYSTFWSHASGEPVHAAQA